jgi:murein L,D-transpeptidase YafK
MRRRLFASATSLALCIAFSARAETPTPENRLSAVVQAIEASRPEVALKRVDSLIHDFPNFRLAYLVRGDLLLSRSRPLETFGDVAKSVPRGKVDALRDEALVRLRAERERPADDRFPSHVLQLRPEQKHLLIVDSRLSRLYLFANDAGRAHFLADYYVTLGKKGMEKTREGDQKTPIGVYHVTSYLSGQKLSDFYGSGAFPINYPNEWDRRLGRKGHGIWLHGTPSGLYSRPPRSSDGCIVLANPDLKTVGSYLQVGMTPVIIADDLEWSAAAAVDAERSSLAAALEQWRADWQSRDIERYLHHYSRNFSSGSENFSAWAAHKRSVNSRKQWIKIGLSDISMLRYPREREVVVVTFDQDYRSSNFSNAMRKRQYWRKEDGQWKIIYEGAA